MRLSFAVLGCSLALAQTCPTPAQLASDLAAGSQAGVIGLAGVNPINCPETEIGFAGIARRAWDSPTAMTLPATSGTVYNRLFVYHVNSSSVNRLKFTIHPKPGLRERELDRSKARLRGTDHQLHVRR